MHNTTCIKGIQAGNRDDLFAATPPLEALNLLFSMAMADGIGFKQGMAHAGRALDAREGSAWGEVGVCGGMCGHTFSINVKKRVGTKTNRCAKF